MAFVVQFGDYLPHKEEKCQEGSLQRLVVYTTNFFQFFPFLHFFLFTVAKPNSKASPRVFICFQFTIVLVLSGRWIVVFTYTYVTCGHTSTAAAGGRSQTHSAQSEERLQHFYRHMRTLNHKLFV